MIIRLQYFYNILNIVVFEAADHKFFSAICAHFLNFYGIKLNHRYFASRTAIIHFVMYPGHLGDHYTALGTQTLVPKKHFSSFLFSVVFHQKICWCRDQWFHKASNISKWLRRHKHEQKRKTIRKKDVEPKEEIIYESVFVHLNMQ